MNVLAAAAATSDGPGEGLWFPLDSRPAISEFPCNVGNNRLLYLRRSAETVIMGV
jgi:hypothetical protein